MALRILIVCTANVCRSPMAAEFFRHHLAANGVEAVVTSAGTHGGNLFVDPDAVKAMDERGFNLSAHRPRLVDRAMVTADGADLVVTMTRTHLQVVAVMGTGVFQRSFTAKELSRRTQGLMFERQFDESTFGAWRDAVGEGRVARNLIRNDPADDIADPYGLSLAEHRRTADELDLLMASIAVSIAAWVTP